MQYALLIYNPDDGIAAQAQRPIDPGIEAVLGRPDVTGWIRLHAPGSATTVSHQADKTLLTDGPFIDSKEFLGGLVLVEAGNLDGALAIAAELAGRRRAGQPGRLADRDRAQPRDRPHPPAADTRRENQGAGPRACRTAGGADGRDDRDPRRAA